MNTTIDSTLIEKQLKEIINVRFNISPDFWNEDTIETPLLTSKVGLLPRDLVYLLFDIENKFNIKIKDEYIINGQFNSFKNIKNILLEQLGNN